MGMLRLKAQELTYRHKSYQQHKMTQVFIASDRECCELHTHTHTHTQASRNRRREEASEKSLKAADKQLSKYLQAKILEQMTGQESSVLPPAPSGSAEQDLFCLPPLPAGQLNKEKLVRPRPYTLLSSLASRIRECSCSRGSLSKVSSPEIQTMSKTQAAQLLCQSRTEQ